MHMQTITAKPSTSANILAPVLAAAWICLLTSHAIPKGGWMTTAAVALYVLSCASLIRFARVRAKLNLFSQGACIITCSIIAFLIWAFCLSNLSLFGFMAGKPQVIKIVLLFLPGILQALCITVILLPPIALLPIRVNWIVPIFTLLFIILIQLNINSLLALLRWIWAIGFNNLGSQSLLHMGIAVVLLLPILLLSGRTRWIVLTGIVVLCIVIQDNLGPSYSNSKGHLLLRLIMAFNFLCLGLFVPFLLGWLKPMVRKRIENVTNCRIESQDCLQDQAEEKSNTRGTGGFWRRGPAFFIDIVILSFIGAAIGVFAYDFFASLGSWGRLAGLLVFLTYFGILNSSLGKGQTIGKKLCGIRVISRSGESVSLSKSLFRSALIGIPYCFPDALYSPQISTPIGATLFSRLVIILIIVVIYLFLFNRKTHQSLHDLLFGTYVVPITRTPPPSSFQIWRGHLLIVALLCLIAIGTPRLAMRYIWPNYPFEELQKTQKAVLDMGKFQSVTATLKRKSTKAQTQNLIINAICKTRPENSDALVPEIILLAAKNFHGFPEMDSLKVTLKYGYDIGISEAWKSINKTVPVKNHRLNTR